MKLVPLSDQNVDQVAKMHLTAFKGHLNVLLGFRYIKLFLSWFYKNESTIHFVAEDEGKVVGYVVGAYWGYQSSLNKYLLAPGIRAFLTRPWLILNRRVLGTIWLKLQTLIGLNKHIGQTKKLYEQPIISLVGIAVAPEAFGRKVGSQLMKAFEESAKKVNYKTMRLSVYRSNERAKAFYIKNGWQEEISEKHSFVVGYYKELPI